MLAQGVHPDIFRKFRISNGDMARHAFRETLSTEVSKDGSGVDEDVLAVFGMRREGWDSWRVVNDIVVREKAEEH